MDKEQLWLKRRCGYISASNLSEVVSVSGKITEGNIDYIRAKRWERCHGYALPLVASPMLIGKEQEPYAIEWFRSNMRDVEIIYSAELAEIPFWNVAWAKFGASPDAFSPDERLVVEVKTVVSNKEKCFYGDDATSYEQKYAKVKKDHLPQILGQFLSNNKVEEIWVLKYLYQDDNILDDVDSPLCSWRGQIYKFNRIDYSEQLSSLRARICLIDKMIDSPYTPEDFKLGSWSLSNGELVQEYEKKSVK